MSIDLELRAPASPLDGLARALLELQPLFSAMPSPVRVAWPPNITAPDAMWQRLAARLEIPPPVSDHCPEELTLLEQCISSRIRRECPQLPYVIDGDHIDAAVASALRHQTASSETRLLNAADGERLLVSATGSSASPPVVLALPIGMPTGLCARWIRGLAADCFVLTWESAGTGVPGDVETWVPRSAATQAADLLTVLDAFEIQRAHVMGICSGAVIAVQAVDREPRRAESVSLWHGDFPRASSEPATRYQRGMDVILRSAAESPQAAASMHTLFCDSVSAAGGAGAKTGIREDLAHWLLHPFATAGSLFRFARLKHELMAADLSGAVSRMHHRSLIVTSARDETIHPEGSRRVAAALADCQLHVEPDGDHLAVFDAAPDLVRLARSFILHAHLTSAS